MIPNSWKRDTVYFEDVTLHLFSTLGFQADGARRKAEVLNLLQINYWSLSQLTLTYQRRLQEVGGIWLSVRERSNSQTQRLLTESSGTRLGDDDRIGYILGRTPCASLHNPKNLQCVRNVDKNPPPPAN